MYNRASRAGQCWRTIVFRGAQLFHSIYERKCFSFHCWCVYRYPRRACIISDARSVLARNRCDVNAAREQQQLYIYIYSDGFLNALLFRLCFQNGVGGDHRAEDKGAHVRQSDDRRVRLGSATWCSCVSIIYIYNVMLTLAIEYYIHLLVSNLFVLFNKCFCSIVLSIERFNARFLWFDFVFFFFVNLLFTYTYFSRAQKYIRENPKQQNWITKLEPPDLYVHSYYPSHLRITKFRATNAASKLPFVKPRHNPVTESSTFNTLAIFTPC